MTLSIMHTTVISWYITVITVVVTVCCISVSGCRKLLFTF